MDRLISSHAVRPHPDAQRVSYPHLSPVDSAIWRRFLISDLLPISFIDYDVSLGAGHVVAEVVEEEFGSMWVALRQKRIDVVCEVGDETWIVEVKPVQSMTALGQVLTYEWLWLQDVTRARKTRKVVICGQFDADLAGVYALLSVSCLLA